MSQKELTIERLAFGGEGIGRIEGKVVFVPGTVPGDRVLIKVLSDHGRFERGEVLRILQPSADRIDPACTVFGRCGGCQWQHVDYKAQLRWKEEILRESLTRIGKIPDPPLSPILSASHPWHYRKRIRLKNDPKSGIGFYSAKSHEIVPFDVCLISDPRLNERLAMLREDSQFLKQSKEFEVSLNHHGAKIFDLSSGEPSFSQVNPEQNRVLVDTVLQFAFGNADPVFTRKRTVLELFAGSGNFTFSLSAKAGRVIAVESNRDAVKEGIRLMEEQKVENISWVEGTAEWGIKKTLRQKVPVDVLVLDPPRKGAHEILDCVPLIKPRTIVYVSCDPTTLARDLKELVRRHYRLEKVQPIDMFPQTYHIESVAHLSLL